MKFPNIKFDRSLSSGSHNDVCGQIDIRNKAMGTFQNYTNVPNSIVHYKYKRLD